MEILIFGGTSEGRELALWAASRGVQVTACSATVYGGVVLGEHENLTALTEPLGHDGMRALMRGGDFACCVDATHPYAATITQHVREACEECGLPYVRCIREGQPEGDWLGAVDTAHAARIANGVEGNILTTTGSKELGVFVDAIEGFEERLFVRVLPVQSSLAHANELGIPTSHVIAMQGPFSQALNEALIDEFDIRCMVTKASGKAGGFMEKAAAAQNRGIELVVVDRPVQEEGLSLEETKEELVRTYGA